MIKNNNDTRDLLEKILQYAAKKGVSECDVIAEKGHAFSLQAQAGKIDKTKVSSSQVMGIRVIHQQKTGLSYCESWDSSSLENMVDDAISNSVWAAEDSWQKITVKNDKNPLVDEQKNTSRNDEQTSLEHKKDLALSLESKILQADKRVNSVPYSGYSEGESEKFYLNHLGTYGEQRFKSYSCSTSALAKEGERSSLYSHGMRAHHFSELSVDRCVQKTLEHALPLLQARPVTAGHYDVIFRTEVLHSLWGCFQSLFSGKSCMEGKNPFRDKREQVVASPLLTWWDRPRYADAFHQYYFDDEGQATEDLLLVEKGVLKNFYHNSVTGNFFQQKSTGHAGRSAKSALGVSGTHWVIEAGETAESDLRSGRYLQIVELQGLSSGTNALSGHFSVAAKGYLFDGGECQQAVSGITLSGNIFALFQSLQAVGDQIHADNDKSFFSPILRFEGMSVAG